MSGDPISSVAIILALLLPVFVGLRLHPWPRPRKPGPEQLIENADGTVSRAYDPGRLGKFQREERDYFA